MIKVFSELFISCQCKSVIDSKLHTQRVLTSYIFDYTLFVGSFDTQREEKRKQRKRQIKENLKQNWKVFGIKRKNELKIELRSTANQNQDRNKNVIKSKNQK